MFEKLQMEALKKAAKLDGSGSPDSRPRGKFPYMYGYTDSGDLVIVNEYYACIIYKSFVYIDTKTVFRDLNPVSTNVINRMTDDDNTEPATLTSDLHKIPASVHQTKGRDITANVFEVDGGERVYVNTKLLKPFNDLKIPLTFRGSSRKSPIFVYDEDGCKLGLVLPVLVSK